LQLDPTDAALQSVLGSLLDDAASQARRARIKANNAKAVTFAPSAFSQGVTLEADATQSRAADTKETAIQSFWKATRLFELSAQEATAEQARLRQLEEDERARQQQLADQRARDTQPEANTGARPPAAGAIAPVTEMPKPPIVDRAEEEKARIRQTLQGYEAAYDNLNAAAVKRVYPAAPESLARSFSQYEFYRLEMIIEKVELAPSAGTATAICRLSHFFQPKVGKSQQEVRKQEFTLQKQGDAWVIVRIQAR
jgi:hypothetical protein